MKLAALALVLLAPVFCAHAQEAPKKIQTLIITGQDVPGHVWRSVTPELRTALEATGRFEVRVMEEFRGAGPETLAPYDLVVLNYYEQKRKELWWGDRAQNALLDYVKSGKGLVMFHFSTAAFEGWTEYEKMSGGNWRPGNGHHSPSHDFTVTIRDKDHPITRGLREKFRQPWDELYANLKWQPEGTFHVLATAWDDHKLYVNPRQPTPGDGKDQPMLWTVDYGQGRVFATVLGHDVAAVRTPAFVTTFTRGAEWAATNAVTLPIPPEMAAGGRRSEELTAVTPGVGAAPPSDAVVLFNGRDMTGWVNRKGEPSGCKVENGDMVCPTGAGHALTERKFASAQIHLEFLTPPMPEQKGQLKGNSGVYLQGLTEIQILDGFENPTYSTGQLGAVYGQSAPLVNAARKPGEWSSFDIVYRAPKCSERGALLETGRLTLFVNGVLVQDNVRLGYRGGMCQPGPLLLQDHSGFKDAPHTVMKFRNIWMRPLE